MELSDLRVFVAVVEEGGISHAANKLHRVPSNITARVQKLEKQLDTQLFIRDNKKLVLSAHGERLLVNAKDLLQRAEQTISELKGDTPQGKLRLGTIEMAAATRMVEPIMCFHHRYPDVELEVHNAPTGRLIEKVLNGELDIALVSDPTPDSRLDILPAFTETLVLVSDLQHPNIETPKDLGSQPTVLGFSHLCSYRRAFDRWLENADKSAKTLDIHSYHALLSCVTAGMGIGIIPQSVLDSFPFKHAIKQHPIKANWGRSQSCLVWRKDSLTINAQAFADLLLGKPAA